MEDTSDCKRIILVFVHPKYLLESDKEKFESGIEMSGNYLNLVYSCRTYIYIAMFVAVAVIEVKSFLNASTFSYNMEKTFWPPDMVPHPHPPHIPDKDDNMARKFN